MATPRKGTSAKGTEAGAGAKAPAARRVKKESGEAVPAGEPVARRVAKPAPSGPAADKATQRPGRKAADIELAHQIAGFLEELKHCLDAAIMRYSDRVGGELDRVGKELAGETPPSGKVLRRIRTRLEEVRLKPHKGRVKDFVRLEDLAEDLNDLLPPSDVV